jgi:tetratricopeptide (TPR) repeat protein
MVATLLSLWLILFPLIEARGSLPPIPNVKTDTFPPETRAQVQQAYKAALKYPEDPKAVGTLCMLLDLYHRSGDAVQCYQRAHLLQPREFRWLYYLGSLRVNQKQNVQAIIALRQALALKPHYVAAELDLALALLSLRKEADSERVYKNVLATWPESAEAYFGLGRIYANEGKISEAKDHFQRACTLFPDYGAAHYALARIYQQQGQADEAKQELRLYAQHSNLLPPAPDPLRDALWALNRDANSHLDRGAVLAQSGHLEGAVREEEEATRLDPSLAKAHSNLIILYGKLRMAAKAKQQYQKVVTLAPNSFPEARYNYGIVLLNQQQYLDAENVFKDALRIQSDYPEAHLELGLAFEGQGRLSQALTEFREALQEKPGYSEAHFQIGKIFVNEGKYVDAIHHFHEALSENSQTPAYLYALGATYARAGDLQSALAYLKMAHDRALAQHQEALAANIERDIKDLSNKRPADQPAGNLSTR